MSGRADRVMWFRHSSDIYRRGAPQVIIALYRRRRPDPLPGRHSILLTLNLLHCVFPNRTPHGGGYGLLATGCWLSPPSCY